VKTEALNAFEDFAPIHHVTLFTITTLKTPNYKHTHR